MVAGVHIAQKLTRGVRLQKMISMCKGGSFDTPEIHALKKIFEKTHGHDVELGSWKQVVDRHGPAVAFAALRQGTLPYIPHTLLRPGHGVAWPESHEFILTRRWWKESWRNEITYRGTSEADTAKEERDIRKWLMEKCEI